MLAQAKSEHIKALFKAYPGIHYPAFPTICLLVYVFYGRVDTTLLLTWATVAFALHVLQLFLAYRFSKQASAEFDYKKWENVVAFNCLLVGGAWSLLPWFATTLPVAGFIGLVFLYVLAMLIFSTYGYKRPFMVYVSPMVLSMMISCMRVFDDFWYIWCLWIAVWFLLLSLSHHFEGVLLRSIQVRFEKDNLLKEKDSLLKELAEKKEAAEIANRAKSMFLATATHDLRQPLHALGFFCNSAKSLSATREQGDLNQKMQTCIESFNALFENILDISKLDSSVIKPTIEHFYIQGVLQDIHRQFGFEASQKGLSLTLESNLDSVVETDPILLERVLGNLINNAVNNTSAGCIDVSTEVQGDTLALTIADTGCGISKSELDNVFTEFYQINDHRVEYNNKGLGLGLSIVKRLCSLLQIELSMQSELHKGTTIKMAIPLGNAQEVASSDNESIVDDITGVNVLLLDDDVAILEATSGFLTYSGCNVIAANSIAQAMLKMGGTFKPDIIISDYFLGHETGNALDGVVLTGVPKLFITGDTSSESLQALLNHECYVLHKPVQPRILQQYIAKLIKLARVI